MGFLKTARAALALAVLPLCLGLEPAQAAQSLASVQKQVTSLQQDAAASAEGAQTAKVQLDQLRRTLSGIKKEAARQGETVGQLRKSLGVIAVEEYKSGGLSQGLELLFSSDPTLYLSAAGSLDSITRRKSLQLHRFAAAQQRLNATTITVNDKMSLVRATQARLVAQSALAQSKLKEVGKVLAKLKKSDRIRLAKLTQKRNAREQKSSLAFAKTTKRVSGRAGIAVKFALKQIGDRYVFGAAGMVYWDCSGLTMRAYRAAGVSLPHSAAAQSRYGRRVPFNQLRPGDLVFFGSPISHNGMYIGGGKMVDAPHTGARVRVEAFGSYFGRLRLVAARRF
ncbi:MAG: NlpC/P60 family protein [Candidatus Nanopelagicaceae bacterium]|nr:NlpC/P60 family protein [Candidatus Nanopelagicaceae bacterium]